MTKESEILEPLRVLAFDGGGMRGIYSAAYLARLIELFTEDLGVENLDLVNSVDLIAGTSTGAIVGCAVAKGYSLEEVVLMYREHGPKIFPQKLKSGAGAISQIPWRSKHLKDGAEALKKALTGVLEDDTFGDIYEKRGIALAIPAVELGYQRSWVFKTGHLGTARDNQTKLVDACLATSAAPIYRSLAAIPSGSSVGNDLVFADGGLWANNPVLVGLIDALKMSPDRPIEVFSLGTCPRPGGEQISTDKLDRGFLGWKFGAGAAELSIGAQEFAYDNIARMLAAEFSNLGRSVRCMRFPSGPIREGLRPHLDLDATSSAAMDALINQAMDDALLAKSMCDDPADETGVNLRGLFEAAAA